MGILLILTYAIYITYINLDKAINECQPQTLAPPSTFASTSPHQMFLQVSPLTLANTYKREVSKVFNSALPNLATDFYALPLP